jgi:gamma-tubulin complex component 2
MNIKGIEGTHITHHPDHSAEDDDPLQGIRFVVSPSLGQALSCVSHHSYLNTVTDASLRDLVERILPLGMYYTAISSFIELRSDLDFGLVNHALCAAIRDMLKVTLLRGKFPLNIGIQMTPRTIKLCSPN